MYLPEEKVFVNMREVSEKYPTRSIDCSSQQKVREKQLVAFVVQFIISILKVWSEEIVSFYKREERGEKLTADMDLYPSVATFSKLSPASPEKFS